MSGKGEVYGTDILVRSKTILIQVARTGCVLVLGDFIVQIRDEGVSRFTMAVPKWLFS